MTISLPRVTFGMLLIAGTVGLGTVGLVGCSGPPRATTTTTTTEQITRIPPPPISSSTTTTEQYRIR